MAMDLSTGLVVVGASLLVLGVLSRLIKRLFLSSVLLALLAGVVLGPEGFAVVEPTSTREGRKVMEELARVTLAIALVGTGLQVTRADLRKNDRAYGSLLTVGMVGMWVLTGLGAWLILDLPLWAGCDPALGRMGGAGPLGDRVLGLGPAGPPPPVVPLALAPTRIDARTVAFLGWFGPLGVAAIFYAIYVERFAIPQGERIFAAAALAICVSVLVHSLTATPGVRLFARRSPFATLRHRSSLSLKPLPRAVAPAPTDSSAGAPCSGVRPESPS